MDMEYKVPVAYMSKSTKKLLIVICIVIVILCIVFPSAYRKIQIRPFVKELVGNSWGHISNFENEDFCSYQFVDENTVVCTDRSGDKHIGEWKITDIGKTSTSVFGGIRPTEGKSITIWVCYQSTKASGWEKTYTSDIVIIHDSETGKFWLFEKPGDSSSNVLHKFGPPK